MASEGAAFGTVQDLDEGLTLPLMVLDNPCVRAASLPPRHPSRYYKVDIRVSAIAPPAPRRGAGPAAGGWGPRVVMHRPTFGTRSVQEDFDDCSENPRAVA